MVDLPNNKPETNELEKLNIPQLKKSVEQEIDRESAPEKNEERAKEVMSESLESDKPAIKIPIPIPEPDIQKDDILEKSETLKQIEIVLEEDLANVYFQMDKASQQEFKQKGEETAKKVEAVLQKPKFKAKEIFKLILEWLKSIPGVSSFFIKQEAKIKTDKIIKIKQ